MNFPGTIRLFRVLGITVYLHLSWLVIAFIEVTVPRGYHSMAWNVAEYLTLFAIVLLHEFGHALACRSVGGRAEQIVLWPLGGIAFVSPPPRPGAMLWSIAAGPLVNVLLVPVTLVLAVLAGVTFASTQHHTNIQHYLWSIALINFMLLVFNMLPIYPLDGGQILQSILWFFLGRARSLRFTAGLGLVTAAVLGIVFVLSGQWWLVLMALFVGTQAFRGYKIARLLAAQEAAAEPWDVPQN